MASSERTISFYRLSLERQEESKYVCLTNEVMEEYFSRIYSEKMRVLEQGRAIDLTWGNGNYVLEVMKYEGHKVFAKLGHQNPADTVALRDKDTLKSESVPMTSTQLLEIFTYFIIDFSTGIVSHIGIGNAPRISVIRGFFDKYLLQENIETRLAAIVVKDILKTIIQKKRISKITMSITVPNDKELSELLGLSLNSFDLLKNTKTRTIQFSIVAEKNKNIFGKSTDLGRVIEDIKNTFGPYVNKAKVNAKNDNEKTQTYDLFEYCFTKKIVLRENGDKSLTEAEYYETLWATYQANKQELLKYARQ